MLKNLEFLINNGFFLFFSTILALIMLGVLLHSAQRRFMAHKTDSFYIKILQILFNAVYLPIILYFTLRIVCYDNNYLVNFCGNDFLGKIKKVYSISSIWLSWMTIARIMENVSKIFFRSTTSNTKNIFMIFFRIVSFFAYFIMIIVILNKLGLTLKSIVALLGGPAIIISFAARNLISNYLSGILMYFNNSFKVNDYIIVLGTQIEGKVLSIGIKKTILLTVENVYMDVPNAIFLNSPIVNRNKIKNGVLDIDFYLDVKTCTYINELISEIQSYISKNKKINQDLGYSVSCDRMKNHLSYVIKVKAFSIHNVFNKIKQDKSEIMIDILKIIKEKVELQEEQTHRNNNG